MFPCCRERKLAPRVNQYGSPVPKSIDDPLSEWEDEESGFFGLFGGYETGAGSDPENCELDDAPLTFDRPRSDAVSAEVYGPNNPRSAFTPIAIQKTEAQLDVLRNAFKGAKLFKDLDDSERESLISAVSIQTSQAGEFIFRQGDEGQSLYVVLTGKVDLYRRKLAEVDVVAQKSINDDTLDKSELLKSLDSGAVFGELALLWNTPRSLTIRANESDPPVMGCLPRDVFSKCVIQLEMDKQESKQEKLRNVKLLEMLKPEQIAKLAETMKLEIYQKDEKLITQGEEGREFFILVEGECVATVETFFLGVPVDEQEHRRYHSGDLFGEKAVLRAEPRAATIKAVTDNVKALRMSRTKFERLLGPLSQLQENQYLTDPRKLIADFYEAGDASGPAGSHQIQGTQPKGEESSWFCVYRPTSRDAIAKMLSGCAVGKGLNVKGKSAKKGVLSGFVPFLQISDNAHKEAIEASPSNSRVTVYYRNAVSRETALAALYSSLYEAGPKLTIDDKTIKMKDDYKPDVYGLEMPEPLLKEAYIMAPNIVPRIGWETGRASEPAFMDMNLHAVRDSSEPKVVLYQFDELDPMNPRGLLIAYAEKFVKPVVSDFDTFTVGSKGISYEPIPANQAELATWSLEKADKVLGEPGDSCWTSRWLAILKEEAEKGFHPEFPKYGFGDPTSYRLIGDVVNATISCGAVRHGAECFNFYFPQELDTEYLIVWNGFDDRPWDYLDEKGLRRFLTERVEEGFVFPFNPVWSIRDKGWYEVLQKMRAQPSGLEALKAWDPPGAGLIAKIDEIHAKFPNGFGKEEEQEEQRNRSTARADIFGMDVAGCEKADLAGLELRRSTSRWTQLRANVKVASALKGTGKKDETLDSGAPPSA